MFARRFFPGRFFAPRFFPSGTSIPGACTLLIYNGETLALRCPSFGDTEELEQARINRRTRGNELKIFRDIIWPEQTALKFRFENLKTSDKEALTQFLSTTLGQIITLKDYKDRFWDVLITNPDTEFTEEYEHACGCFSIELEFKGVEQ